MNLVVFTEPPIVCASYSLDKSRLDIKNELNLASLDIQNYANLLHNSNTNLLATQC